MAGGWFQRNERRLVAGFVKPFLLSFPPPAPLADSTGMLAACSSAAGGLAEVDVHHVASPLKMRNGQKCMRFIRCLYNVSIRHCC